MDISPECQAIRPTWTPDLGQASSFGEFLILLNSPHGYIWIVLVALTVWKTHFGLFTALTFYSLFLLGYWNTDYATNDALRIGYDTGCVGTLLVTIRFLVGTILICIALGIYKAVQSLNLPKR